MRTSPGPQPRHTTSSIKATVLRATERDRREETPRMGGRDEGGATTPGGSAARFARPDQAKRTFVRRFAHGGDFRGFVRFLVRTRGSVRLVAHGRSAALRTEVAI